MMDKYTSVSYSPKNTYFFSKENEELCKEYAKNIKPEKIIEFIESLFTPNDFYYLTYDENFSKNIKKLSDKNVQIWCEGPVLLIEKNIDVNISERKIIYK